MNWQNHIVSNPNICHGKPTFKGTRVMVADVLELLEAGTPEKEILRAFPSLNKNSIRAALGFAAASARSEHFHFYQA